MMDRISRPIAGIATLAAAFASSLAAGSDSPAAPAITASARPGDDFYAYANQAWLATVAVPDGRESYDTTAMLRDENERRVAQLLAAAARGAEGGGAARKVGDYYASVLDAAGIEAKGFGPLRGDLAAIDAIADRRGLSAYLGGTIRSDDGSDTAVDGLFGLWVHQGFTDADRYLPHIVQGGLALDREDYLDPGAEKAARRAAYRSYVASVLKMAGRAGGEAGAQHVLALETAIARTHASRADTDDPFKTNNSWRRRDFATRAPGMDWNAFFGAAGLPRQGKFIVWQPSAVRGAAALVAATPIDVWKDYLAFHLIDHHASVLPRAIAAGRADALGPARAPDRAAEAAAATTRALGEAIGRLYVARYFPPRDKAEAAAMVANLRIAFRGRIAGLRWMTPATRARALAKLAALRVGLGYPDRWRDDSGLSVVRGDAYGNARRAELFVYRRDVAKLGRPVDPGEWAILPQTVSAIILFSPNAMQFSAGLLQPPYFEGGGDLASNYGSAGAGIAHEISHSFDRLGNLYDARGRLGSWWTARDEAGFRTAAAPLTAQYDGYCAAPGVCVKGTQVLGESAADLAGINVAHDAYLFALHGRADAIRDGLTGEQRFFLAFARRWRRWQNEAAFRGQMASDSHAPGRYRSFTVRNVDAWYRAYRVTGGDRLYLPPAARVRIW